MEEKRGQHLCPEQSFSFVASLGPLWRYVRCGRMYARGGSNLEEQEQVPCHTFTRYISLSDVKETSVHEDPV